MFARAMQDYAEMMRHAYTMHMHIRAACAARGPQAVGWSRCRCPRRRARRRAPRWPARAAAARAPGQGRVRVGVM
eukprot:scaffold59140_cov21-Phaeocystis_antarctica.AAC.1